MTLRIEPYAPMPNSPLTTLAASISAIDTTIEVANGANLPPAPNIATIGTTEAAETILYATKVGNVLSGITRSFQGIAKNWDKGTYIARTFTAHDLETLQRGYRFVQTLYFTDDAEFKKGDYLWLRAVKAKCQGGGGAGGGCEKTGSGEAAEGSGGGGGGYGEKFIMVNDLNALENITIGKGAAESKAGQNGDDGGNSSFGDHITANGGIGGTRGTAGSDSRVHPPGNGGSVSGEDFGFRGSDAGVGRRINSYPCYGNFGGGSYLAGIAVSHNVNTRGKSGKRYGGGSSGARSGASVAARGSLAGGDGIVIVELYA